ncbi:hypothetical protein H8D91_02285 [archaeon]|nr:hypothetical protein [archaeon]
MKMKIDNSKFDILFLCHEKDVEILKSSIKYAQKNVAGYRKIFVLSQNNYFPENKDITFVDEKIFPFNKSIIGKQAPKGRAGWYYQQFLKLYFLRVTGKEVLDNVLCIDADSMFIKKTTFFEGEIPLYNVDIGAHQPYFDILEKVFGFGKQHSKYSGTTHHMMYQRKYISEIFDFVKKKYGVEFWKVIMDNVDSKTISGFSEQDLYLNYMLKHHPNKIKIRKMRFMNFPYYTKRWVKLFSFLGYHYLSAHDYLINDKFSAPKRLVVEFITFLGIKRFIKEGLMKLKILKRV